MRSFVALALLAGCWGYQQVDNQMIGQVKKVHHNTPIVCPNFDSVDVSMGIMRNGVGSMSTKDMTLTIWNKADLAVFDQAARDASIVEVTYSTWRFAPCREDDVVQYVKLAK